MAKIKFDVSDSDPDKAATRGSGGASPKPGMYVATFQINPTYAKGGSGNRDKKRPQLEIIYTMAKADKKSNERFAGGRVWDYLPVLPNENAKEDWAVERMDQFLQAIGVATKKKRTGTLDTDKLNSSKAKVLVVVRAGTNLNGGYKGTLGQVLPYDPDTFKEAKKTAVDDDEETEDLTDEAPDEEEEDEEEEENSDDSEEGEDLDELGRAADDDEDEDAVKRLTELSEAAGIDPDNYATWAEVATALGEGTDGEEEEEVKPKAKEKGKKAKPAEDDDEDFPF